LTDIDVRVDRLESTHRDPPPDRRVRPRRRRPHVVVDLGTAGDTATAVSALDYFTPIPNGVPAHGSETAPLAVTGCR
jgi:hypothetical protein